MAVHNEDTQIAMTRGEFVWWVLGPFAAAIAVSALGHAAGFGDMATGVINLCWGLVYPYFLYQRIVRRARDAGHGKGIAYWSIVPGVNVGTILYLLFKPSVRASPATSG